MPVDVNKFFEDNIKLVYLVYNRRIHKNDKIESSQDDLIQEGMIGLYKGCCSYDPNCGIKCSTYLAQCIENAMLTFLKRQEKSTINNVIRSIDEPIPGSEGRANYIDLIPEEKQDQFSLTMTIAEMLKCYEKHTIKFGTLKQKRELEKNKKILKRTLLLLNCGNSYRTIAKKLGMTVPTLLSRVDTLKKSLIESNYI